MYNRGRPGRPRGFGFGGFALASGKKDSSAAAPGVANPLGSSRPGASTTHSSTFRPRGAQPGARNMPAKPAFNDDSDDEVPYTVYSDEEEEEEQARKALHQQADDDEEEDELDKFMAGIENQVRKESSLTEEEKAKKRVRRDDLEEEDDQETYFNYVKNQPITYYPEDDEEIEYDEDGNPIIPERKKIIEPLPRIDHSEIAYKRFEKNFYIEHKEISSLSHQEIADLRNKLGIKVTGAQPVRPCSSFAHFGFDEHLMEAIRKSEYTQPTPIQCQSVPVALNGRDIIGVAKTGSGKTAAFLWPMLVHIMDQPELEPGDGPIGLILAPTRELCQQIFFEAKKFGKVYNIKACCVFGGGNMYEQSKALSEGVEIVVATPGRLIDHIKKKATNLERVTYIVFDEADRMFDMGFEPQVRSIANHVRPDRQCLLFSATFKKKVEMLCRDILTDPIRIVIGELGEANEDVTQIVKVFGSGSEKWQWLGTHLVSYTSVGSVLIFVTKKANSEELSINLKKNDFEVGLLHGDMDQFERNKIITNFRKKEFPILVATDVAARGLDIPSIKTVINYDVARDIHTHTHRIGRTGRAGEKGVAYTLITPMDQNFCGDLVRNLEGANQEVPEALMEFAMKNAWFRKSRFRGGKGKDSGSRKERTRPGLGSASTTQVGVFTVGGSSIGGSALGRGVLGGPGSDRFTSIKAAFKSQYNAHFKAASSSNSNTWDASSSHSTAEPLAPARKQKKTRWDPA